MAASASAPATASTGVRSGTAPVTTRGFELDYVPVNWPLVKSYWLGIRGSLFAADWDDDMKQKFNCFVDVATAVTDAVAEEMARSLGHKTVLTTGLPCSFNPGFWDVCWQKDCSWTTPWSVPTLRVLVSSATKAEGCGLRNSGLRLDPKLYHSLRPKNPLRVEG